MSSKITEIETTFPTRQAALEAARSAVENALAACAQTGAEITSTYRWKGEIFTEAEFPVKFKTAPEIAEKLRAHIFKIHPYECPQWIAREALAESEYAKWVRQNCAQNNC